MGLFGASAGLHTFNELWGTMGEVNSWLNGTFVNHWAGENTADPDQGAIAAFHAAMWLPIFRGSLIADEEISPALIRFSQSSVSGVEEITTSMKISGWQGAPIDVVRIADGGLTTFDNTRVLAASRAGIDVRAIVHGADDLFPSGRWTPKSGIEPSTWDQAVQSRIGQQNSLYRTAYPNGSQVTGATQ